MEHPAQGEPERQRVDRWDRGRLAHQYGERGAGEVGGDHDAAAREAVDDRPGQRAEREHRESLEHDRSTDRQPGAGEGEDQRDERDVVDAVADSGHALGGEQLRVAADTKQRPVAELA